LQAQHTQKKACKKVDRRILYFEAVEKEIINSVTDGFEKVWTA